jgi:type II secretory pathway pseudopilin PulG
MYKQKSSLDRRRAFTLIEIMVAAVITIIMVGLVIQITSEVLKIWNKSVGKLAANAEARIAMELLTSDLETALLINNNQQWLRVETETDVGAPTAGQTVGLKLFAPALDRPSEPGNICAIGYRLAFAKAYDTANTNSFVLFRALEGPSGTFTNLLGPDADDRQVSLDENIGSTPNFWRSDSIVSADNYLAGNIVDFKIYIYGIDELTGEEIILNSSGSFNGYAKNDTDFNGTIDLDYIYGGTGASAETPVFAEILLTVVSDEGLDILSLPDLAGTGYANEEEVVLKQGEVFKRRVYFQARPL